MINEIQKRPFVRLLFVWIVGILLQTFFELSVISFILLLFPFFVLLFSYFTENQTKDQMYGMRWLWGALFLCLLLFLSIQITADSGINLSVVSDRLLQRKAEAIRQLLLQSFKTLQLSKDEKSVLATITLGYRKAMPYELRQQFTTIGVAHLLAVSGFHVGVVGMMASKLLSVLTIHSIGRWIKYFLVLFIVWGYAGITGLAASAIRAAVMLSIYFTGKQLRRRVDGYNTLAASAFFMLVYNPLYLFDIDFQLSYLAVLSILYFQPRLNSLILVRNPLVAIPWGWVTVTLSAQLGVTMLCLYYFGQFSVVFLLANLPLTLLATILIPVGMLWMLTAVFVSDIGWLRYCVEYLTHSMVRFVDLFSKIPGATVTFRFDFTTMFLGYLSLLLMIWYWKSKTPKILLVSLFVLLMILIRLFIKEI